MEMDMMDPLDLKSIIDPIVENNIDYVKGNRFMTGKAFDKIPKVRYFGNAILSLLTKSPRGIGISLTPNQATPLAIVKF